MSVCVNFTYKDEVNHSVSRESNCMYIEHNSTSNAFDTRENNENKKRTSNREEKTEHEIEKAMCLSAPYEIDFLTRPNRQMKINRMEMETKTSKHTQCSAQRERVSPNEIITYYTLTKNRQSAKMTA